jgi:alpha-glucosidase
MYPSPQVDFGYDISNYDRRRPAVRHPRRLRPPHRRSQSTTSASCSTWSSTTPPTSTPGSSTPPAPAPIPNATGTSGTTASPANGVTATRSPSGTKAVVPPNNWVSLFGGSAWEWVPAVHQFYYHKFYKQQPDLNWRNPAVEKAMFDAMRFWLDRGVAGFRLDAITTSSKTPQLRDEPEPAASTPGRPQPHDPTPTICPRSTTSSAACAPWSIDLPRQPRPHRRNLPPNTAELSQMVRRPQHDELQLPHGHARRLPHRKRNKLERPTSASTSNRSRDRARRRSPSSSSTTTTTSAPWDRFGDGVHNARSQAHRHHPLHHPLHRPHVLRRRDRHDHHTPPRARKTSGPHRHHRLAQGKRPRRRAHSHAVDTGTSRSSRSRSRTPPFTRAPKPCSTPATRTCFPGSANPTRVKQSS